MQRLRLLAILMLVPAFAACAVVGCSSNSPTKAVSVSKDSTDSKEVKTTGAGGELASTGWGTLKGKVTLDGDVPASKDIPVPDDNKDKSHCLKGDMKDQTWRVSADKGVANVVVWLRAPEGKYFKIPDGEKKVTSEVVVDQPYCAFEPHVVVLYPSFYDASTKKQVETGQAFKVKNSAPIAHNTKIAGKALLNPEKNESLPAGKDMVLKVKAASASKTEGEEKLNINCDIHKWMNGYAWAFTHPFAAVTKADGTYEIKNAPAGAEVQLVYWHESFGSSPAKVAEKVTLKEGDNTHDLKVKN